MGKKPMTKLRLSGEGVTAETMTCWKEVAAAGSMGISERGPQVVSAVFALMARILMTSPGRGRTASSEYTWEIQSDEAIVVGVVGCGDG